MKKSKKSVFLVSSILGCTALISVGFAAWVITGSPATKEATGTIQVDTVDNNIVSFVDEQCSWVGSNNQIIFGGRAAEEGDWLVNENLENLTVTYHFVIENYAALDSVSATITASNGNYASAVSKGYVGELPTYTIEHGDEGFTTVDGQLTQMAYDLEITFSWGTAFGGNNPMDYYNDEGKTAATHGADAEQKLTELYTLLSDVTYTLTLTATASTSA